MGVAEMVAQRARKNGELCSNDKHSENQRSFCICLSSIGIRKPNLKGFRRAEKADANSIMPLKFPPALQVVDGRSWELSAFKSEGA